MIRSAALSLAAALLPPAPPPAGEGLSYASETYRLDNGLLVTLHPDHSLPQVVIDTWYWVGSKDEAPGRTGFAHLFEHLMFMGTARVPGNAFDVLMESGGGWNNASTSEDRTNYFSVGPSSLLETLLWLDADRLEALGKNMTQEKLDSQREIVRNERRQTSENTPYGKSELILPELLYPASHPYHHSVIGSHEDLEAATLPDVIAFFREFYVPSNATLVVAGDFEPAAVKALIDDTFGALPLTPLPAHRSARPVVLAEEKRILDVDKVEFPKLILAWHSPAEYAAGDAELDLLAAVLAEGPSSRLEKRLVLEQRLAQEVDASQLSAELGSIFQIEVLAAPDADLERIKSEVLAAVAEIQRDGPTADELERARTRTEARFLRRNESLLARAESIQAYRRYFGVSDGFQRDLERRTAPDVEAVREVARAVLGPGRVDLRILPEREPAPATALDARPTDFARRPFTPPAPQSFELSNGIPVHLLARPGTGLFSGSLLVRGGELAVPLAATGAPELAARWIDSGAGGRDKAAFAEAVEALGATVSAGAGRSELAFDCSGLSSRLPETLALLSDLVLHPNLAAADLARERELLLNEIRARGDEPNGVARDVGRALLFGADDARGRPLGGSLDSIGGLDEAALRALVPTLVHPGRAAFVFAGDLEPEALRAELERRFAGWRGQGPAELPALAPVVEPQPGRIVYVHREHAPQTVVQILRPVPAAEGVERAVRTAVDTVFGGTFTSRLNANLREDKGYTYGARSRIAQEGVQFLLNAGAAVSTPHTGDSMLEFQKEFARMHADGISAEELEKAVESSRTRLIDTSETTANAARSLGELVRNGRPLDALAADLEALEDVDLEHANRTARSGLYDWKDCLVVLVGDREAITSQLAAAGFPAPIEVDATGGARP